MASQPNRSPARSKPANSALFPTPPPVQLNKLSTGRDAPELVIIVNPQWETRGNLVSDFGFGQRKADAEKFIASFQPTYCLKQLRVYGDSVRWAWVRALGYQMGKALPEGRMKRMPVMHLLRTGRFKPDTAFNALSSIQCAQRIQRRPTQPIEIAKASSSHPPCCSHTFGLVPPPLVPALLRCNPQVAQGLPQQVAGARGGPRGAVRGRAARRTDRHAGGAAHVCGDRGHAAGPARLHGQQGGRVRRRLRRGTWTCDGSTAGDAHNAERPKSERVCCRHGDRLRARMLACAGAVHPWQQSGEAEGATATASRTVCAMPELRVVQRYQLRRVDVTSTHTRPCFPLPPEEAHGPCTPSRASCMACPRRALPAPQLAGPRSLRPQSIFDRIRTEFSFNQDSLKQIP